MITLGLLDRFLSPPALTQLPVQNNSEATMKSGARKLETQVHKKMIIF